MKMIAVDDEALQLETIVEYLSDLYPDAEIHGFTKVSDVLKHMQTDTADVAVLDISMPGHLNGIDLGAMLRRKNNRIKLLYCTGYPDYAIDAFNLHANGYLRKPIEKDALMREMRYVMQMPVYDDNRPHIHTFGNFDVFADNRPVPFKRKKSKEVLAYLTDREGSWVTNRELVVVLWDETGTDSALSKYVTLLVNEMVADLDGAGIGHIVERRWGKVRLLKDEVVCDYYEYLKGDERARAGFRFEYMSQYSWGEETLAFLVRRHRTINL